MKTINNPENGAPINDLLYKKMLYDLPVGATITVEDELANFFLNTYEFLEEVKLEGEFVCKYGDYASDTKIAMLSHQKSHQERIAQGEGAPQPKEFITPQEELDAERKLQFELVGDDIPQASATDKDGTEWYGPGLVEEKLGRVGDDDDF